MKDVGRAGPSGVQRLLHAGELLVVSVPGQGGDPASGVHGAVSPHVSVCVEHPIGQEGSQLPVEKVAVFGLDERQ